MTTPVPKYGESNLRFNHRVGITPTTQTRLFDQPTPPTNHASQQKQKQNSHANTRRPQTASMARRQALTHATNGGAKEEAGNKTHQRAQSHQPSQPNRAYSPQRSVSKSPNVTNSQLNLTREELLRLWLAEKDQQQALFPMQQFTNFQPNYSAAETDLQSRSRSISPNPRPSAFHVPSSLYTTNAPYTPLPSSSSNLSPAIHDHWATRLPRSDGRSAAVRFAPEPFSAPSSAHHWRPEQNPSSARSASNDEVFIIRSRPASAYTRRPAPTDAPISPTYPRQLSLDASSQERERRNELEDVTRSHHLVKKVSVELNPRRALVNSNLEREVAPSASSSQEDVTSTPIAPESVAPRDEDAFWSSWMSSPGINSKSMTFDAQIQHLRGVMNQPSQQALLAPKSITPAHVLLPALIPEFSGLDAATLLEYAPLPLLLAIISSYTRASRSFDGIHELRRAIKESIDFQLRKWRRSLESAGTIIRHDAPLWTKFQSEQIRPQVRKLKQRAEMEEQQLQENIRMELPADYYPFPSTSNATRFPSRPMTAAPTRSSVLSAAAAARPTSAHLVSEEKSSQKHRPEFSLDEAMYSAVHLQSSSHTNSSGLQHEPHVEENVQTSEEQPETFLFPAKSTQPSPSDVSYFIQASQYHDKDHFTHSYQIHQSARDAIKQKLLEEEIRELKAALLAQTRYLSVTSNSTTGAVPANLLQPKEEALFMLGPSTSSTVKLNIAPESTPSQPATVMTTVNHSIESLQSSVSQSKPIEPDGIVQPKPSAPIETPPISQASTTIEPLMKLIHQQPPSSSHSSLSTRESSQLRTPTLPKKDSNILTPQPINDFLNDIDVMPSLNSPLFKNHPPAAASLEHSDDHPSLALASESMVAEASSQVPSLASPVIPVIDQSIIGSNSSVDSIPPGSIPIEKESTLPSSPEVADRLHAEHLAAIKIQAVHRGRAVRRETKIKLLRNEHRATTATTTTTNANAAAMPTTHAITDATTNSMPATTSTSDKSIEVSTNESHAILKPSESVTTSKNEPATHHVSASREEQIAATKIQAIQRGRVVRRGVDVKQLRQGREATGVTSAVTTMPSTLQPEISEEKSNITSMTPSAAQPSSQATTALAEVSSKPVDEPLVTNAAAPPISNGTPVISTHQDLLISHSFKTALLTSLPEDEVSDNRPSPSPDPEEASDVVTEPIASSNTAAVALHDQPGLSSQSRVNFQVALLADLPEEEDEEDDQASTSQPGATMDAIIAQSDDSIEHGRPEVVQVQTALSEIHPAMNPSTGAASASVVEHSTAIATTIAVADNKLLASRLSEVDQPLDSKLTHETIPSVTEVKSNLDQVITTPDPLVTKAKHEPTVNHVPLVTPEEQLAATKIQAIQRGRVVRRGVEVKQLRQGQKSTTTSSAPEVLPTSAQVESTATRSDHVPSNATKAIDSIVPVEGKSLLAPMRDEKLVDSKETKDPLTSTHIVPPLQAHSNDHVMSSDTKVNTISTSTISEAETPGPIDVPEAIIKKVTGAESQASHIDSHSSPPINPATTDPTPDSVATIPMDPQVESVKVTPENNSSTSTATAVVEPTDPTPPTLLASSIAAPSVVHSPEPESAAPNPVAVVAPTPAAASVPTRLCELCDDAAATLECGLCGQELCAECDADLHRPAKFASHKRTPITN